MNLRINFDNNWKPPICMYLVIIPDIPEVRHVELAKVPPTEKFFDMVRDEVKSYVVEGKEPPAEIAIAIINISDDLNSGRDPVIRAGDYLALMSYARSKKIV